MKRRRKSIGRGKEKDDLFERERDFSFRTASLLLVSRSLLSFWKRGSSLRLKEKAFFFFFS